MFSLADLLPDFAGRFRQVPEIQEGLIRIAWNHCVGERISKASRVIQFHHGNLHVAVRQNEWKTSLLGLKSDIIARMNRYLRQNLIEDLRIEVEKA